MCVRSGHPSSFVIFLVNREFWSQLYGVHDWRVGQPDDVRQLGFLPFPIEDIMCPGETKALHLYEVCVVASRLESSSCEANSQNVPDNTSGGAAGYVGRRHVTVFE